MISFIGLVFRWILKVKTSFVHSVILVYQSFNQFRETGKGRCIRRLHLQYNNLTKPLLLLLLVNTTKLSYTCLFLSSNFLRKVNQYGYASILLGRIIYHSWKNIPFFSILFIFFNSHILIQVLVGIIHLKKEVLVGIKLKVDRKNLQELVEALEETRKLKHMTLTQINNSWEPNVIIIVYYSTMYKSVWRKVCLYTLYEWLINN